jgi:hypothetical protein
MGGGDQMTRATTAVTAGTEHRGRRARPRLLERDRELELITGLLAGACAGIGGALLVEGAAGIGKTSLLDAARGRALDAGMRVFRARGGELERGFAFGAVRQLFEPWLATATADEREAVLADAARLTMTLIAADPTGDDAVPEDQAFAMMHGLYWLVANLAARRPLLLLADDLHWWDAPSLPTLMASAAYAGTPSWTIQTTPNPGTVNLLAGVSCSSPGACTAVGGYTDPSGNALTLAERFASPAAFSPRHRA